MDEIGIQSNGIGGVETTSCAFENASSTTKDNSIGSATRRKRSSSPCNNDSSSRNSRISALSTTGDHTTDQLEKCGRWLASIPRDDITVLRHTVEFREFLEAFERLGDAHLRVVVNGNNDEIAPVPMMGIKQEDKRQYQQQGSSVAFDETNNEKEKQNRESILFNNGGNKSRKCASYHNGHINNSNVETDMFHNAFINTEKLQNGVLSDEVPSQTPTTATEHRRSPKQQQRQMITDHSHRGIGWMKYNNGLTNVMTSIGNGNYFLRFTDDILLRILEFLRCRCLIQTSLTCSRFYKLVIKSATQRTYDIAAARQLGNVMRLLRAKEQIYHVDSDDDEQLDNDNDNIDIDIDGNDDGRIDNDAMIDDENLQETRYRPSIHFNVPVPTLLPGRRVVVTSAGDPEYNGVYYCTDCNGNGFVFAKPRFSSQHSIQQQYQLESMVFDEESNPLRQNRVVGVIRRAGRLPLVNFIDHDDDDNDDGQDRLQARNFQQPQQRLAMAPSNPRRSDKGAEESFQSKLPLRCIIAKAYSRENILWYMSKEIDEMESSVDGNDSLSTTTVTSTINNNTRRRRKRIFSFYAPQMLAGNTPPELSVYPSQTSALLRQHNEWRTLRTTTGLDVPIVEVLD